VARGGHGIETQAPLTETEQADEFLLMGLRLEEGIDIDTYESLGGGLPGPDGLRRLQVAGLIEISDSRLRATSEGRLVLEAVLRELTRHSD